MSTAERPPPVTESVAAGGAGGVSLGGGGALGGGVSLGGGALGSGALGGGGGSVSVVFLAGAGLLLVTRLLLGGHAPYVVDAHAALAALALAAVARAPRIARVSCALAVAAALVSIPTSYDAWVSLLSLPVVLGAAAFYLLGSEGSCRGALLAGAAAGGALNSLRAVYQRVWEWPEALRLLQETGTSADPTIVARLTEARPLGFAVSPDLCGGICLVGAFCGFALALDAPTGTVWQRRARVAAIAAAAVSAGGLVVVRSFGSALALVAGVAVAALLVAAKGPSGSTKRALTVAGAGAAAAVVALGIAFVTRGADALARSAGERVENWAAAWRMFIAHPVDGVGFARFAAAYGEVRGPDANITRYAHSAPAQLLAETGVVGGALFAAAALLVVIALRRRLRSGPIEPATAVLVGALVAAVARLLIDYDGQIAQTACLYAAVAGIVVSEAEPGAASTSQRATLVAAGLLSLFLVLVLAWREGALESEDDGALASYSGTFPFDVEPRLARAALALDALAVCSDDDACRAARQRAFDALNPIIEGPIIEERAHPPAAAFILRARARAAHAMNAGDAGGAEALLRALADVDAALARDPGSAAAHQLGIQIARALERDEDAAARAGAAARWGVAAPP